MHRLRPRIREGASVGVRRLDTGSAGQQQRPPPSRRARAPPRPTDLLPSAARAWTLAPRSSRTSTAATASHDAAQCRDTCPVASVALRSAPWVSAARVPEAPATRRRAAAPTRAIAGDQGRRLEMLGPETAAARSDRLRGDKALGGGP